MRNTLWTAKVLLKLNTMKIKIIIAASLFFLFSCSEKKEKKMGVISEEYSTRSGFKINNSQRRLANIKIEPVKMKNISEEILLTGSIVPDENKSSQINSRIMGRIDKLYFKFTGSTIHKGDLLYEIYSEELQVTQKDFRFISQKATAKSNSDEYFNQLKESAKSKLLLWGLTETQIDGLEKSKETNTDTDTKIYSNTNGIITDILVREGDYLMQGASLFRINDLSTLWVEAQLYSHELASVRNNAEAEIILEGFGNIKTHISFVSPALNSNSIVNIVRAEIPNTNQQLKPGMLATIRLKIKSKNALVLPVDAILQEAKGNSVWIQKADSTFESRMVITGIRNNDEIEIMDGLIEGENVVVTGAFLINSEFKLKRDADPMGGMKM